MEEHETTFKDHFRKDVLSGIKVFCSIDYYLQQIFTSCANEPYLENADFELLKMSYIIQSMTCQQFFCAIPSFFHAKKQESKKGFYSEGSHEKKSKASMLGRNK
eukprot:4670265-Ditylum_brightwellii.AAC.1